MPAARFHLALWLSVCALATPVQQSDGSLPDAVVLLRKVSARLESLSRVAYHYRRELNYASEGYHHLLEGELSIEFDRAQPPIGAIYQARQPSGFEVFNGSEIFRGDVATHSLRMTAIRSAADLGQVSFLYNSLPTLRLALPKFIADPAIAKSAKRRDDGAYELQLRIPRAVLNATGTLSPITLPRDTIYRIAVDGATLLPREVRQTNSQNDDFTLAQFSNLDTNPPKLPAGSWFYSSYPEYHPASSGQQRQPLAAGSAAPDWFLPRAGAANTVSLAETLEDGKTRLVLLEFWISHCGYSIDAVPKINSLVERFAPRGLTVLAVNPDDDERTIELFAKNYAPRFPLVANGEKAAEQYGVSGYPTVFLIDRQKRIVYSGGFDERVLTDAITAALQLTSVSTAPAKSSRWSGGRGSPSR